MLCPEHNTSLLRYTVKSIQSRYADFPYIAITDDSASDRDLKELSGVCPSFRGEKTFSSLINLGFKHAPAEWNFVLIAGTTMRGNLDQKFGVFVEDEKDILFPISEGRTNFVEGTLNGLFIHAGTFREVGDMLSLESLEDSKTVWATVAAEKGCKFKAIIGSKMC